MGGIKIRAIEKPAGGRQGNVNAFSVDSDVIQRSMFGRGLSHVLLISESLHIGGLELLFHLLTI